MNNSETVFGAESSFHVIPRTEISFHILIGAEISCNIHGSNFISFFAEISFHIMAHKLMAENSICIMIKSEESSCRNYFEMEIFLVGDSIMVLYI